jgi:hypothetical protein
MTRLAAAIALLALTLPISAQQTPSVLRGSWSATVGTARVLSGGWAATIDWATPDSARGTWVLVDDGNRAVLEGTWAAAKSKGGWQGTWSARVTAKGGAPGRALSGTWRADMKDPNVRTLAEMLQHAVADQVSGTWRSGSLAGGWRLKG